MYFMKKLLFSDATLFIDVKRRKKVCIFFAFTQFF